MPFGPELSLKLGDSDRRSQRKLLERLFLYAITV